MEFEIKNKKLTDDEFYKIREEILSTWETGKDAVDLQAGIDYQKSKSNAHCRNSFRKRR